MSVLRGLLPLRRLIRAAAGDFEGSHPPGRGVDRRVVPARQRFAQQGGRVERVGSQRSQQGSASYAHSQDHLRQVRDDRTSTLANLGTAVHGDGLLMGIDGDPSCGWLGGGAPGLSCRCSPSCSRLMRSATSTSGRTRFQLRSAILGNGWGGLGARFFGVQGDGCGARRGAKWGPLGRLRHGRVRGGHLQQGGAG